MLRKSGMTETRKLAAILAPDVAEYCKLACADEERTLARLRALRSDLIDPELSPTRFKNFWPRLIGGFCCCCAHRNGHSRASAAGAKLLSVNGCQSRFWQRNALHRKNAEVAMTFLI